MRRRLSPLLLVLALLAGLLLVAPTATAAKPKKVKVTASASAKKAKVGTTIKVKGKVTGRSARSKVVLLKKAKKRWVVVKSGKVNAKKRYTLKTKVAKGTTKYRVKVRKNKRVKAAASRTFKVRGTKKSAKATSGSTAEQAAVDRILADTNAFRAKHGKAALKLSAPMTGVARKWSQRMADTGTFKHNPNYSKQIPAGWRSAGENIAAGYALNAVVQGWIDSPGHRANMLGDFTHIGIGYVSVPGSQYTHYYTQVFAQYL